MGSPAEAMEAALELEKTVNQSLLDLHKCADSRVTRTCATSWRPSISGSRRRGSRTSGTGSSRSSALETVWVCISWQGDWKLNTPFVFLPHTLANFSIPGKIIFFPSRSSFQHFYV